jgi:hypothetical protein
MRKGIHAVTALFAAGIMFAAAPAVRAQGMPQIPTPGPEHDVLKQDAGTWDATIEMTTPMGPMTSSGVETSRMGCGGLCLITDFTGEFVPGMKFEGHGTTVYDATKKMYVNTWTDSMSRGISVGEANYDAAAKTTTGWMEGPDETGKVVKMKSVVEHKDPDTRVFTMYGPDGAAGMTITYKRRK